MLILRKTNAYIGLVLVIIAASLAPILKVPFKGNWNLYQVDNRLFFITFTLIALTAFCLYLRQLKAFRFLAIAFLLWALLMAGAVYFKTNHYFGSKIFDKTLAKTLHFQWGWVVLLVGVLLLVSSVKRVAQIRASSESV